MHTISGDDGPGWAVVYQDDKDSSTDAIIDKLSFETACAWASYLNGGRPPVGEALIEVRKLL